MKTLETELETVLKQNIELRNSLAGYIDENIAVNQKLFILKGELAIQSESCSKEQEKTDTISREKQSIQDQLKEVKTKIKSVNEVVKEKEDTIEMLNIIVENKNLELAKLKDEFVELKNSMSGESYSNSFKCDQCDFTTESKNGLKIHMGRMHEAKCDMYMQWKV